METSEVQKFDIKNFLSKKVAIGAAAAAVAVGVGTMIFSNSMADSGRSIRGATD